MSQHYLDSSLLQLFEEIRTDDSVEFWDFRKFRDERKVEWFDLSSGEHSLPSSLNNSNNSNNTSVEDIGVQISMFLGNPYGTTRYGLLSKDYDATVRDKAKIKELFEKIEELYGESIRNETKLLSAGAFVDTGGGGFGFSHIVMYCPQLFILAIMEYGEW